jgi:hypothetical protein
MTQEPAPEQEQLVEFRWDGFEAGDADADEALYRLRQEGGNADIPASAQHGFAFIPIIVGAIAVIGLAKAIKSFIDDMRVGTVIDMRGEKVTVTKDKNLPRGTVMVIGKDNSVKLENPDAEKISDIIKSAIQGFK